MFRMEGASEGTQLQRHRPLAVLGKGQEPAVAVVPALQSSERELLIISETVPGLGSGT